MPYFDHNATVPLSPAARDAWLETSASSWQNPSSLYRSAARARNLLEAARAEIAETLGAPPERLVFNSGATEGVNAIFAFFSARPGATLLLSPVEHPCGIAAAQRYFPAKSAFVPINSLGRVDLARLEKQIGETRPALVSIMAANNETGLIQPWEDIAEICRRAAVPFHCDASQWIGKLPAENLTRCDFVTASAHKFGGPKSAGLLLIPPGSDFRAQTGGEQERGIRGGTEDFPSIAATLAALRETRDRVHPDDGIADRLGWRHEFEQTLSAQIPGLLIAAAGADRLWNTVSLILPIGANDRWVRKLDRRGFEVSTGSACSSGKETPSHVLAATGFSPEQSKRAIRVSSGWETSREDWQKLAAALAEVFAEIRDEPGDSPLTQVIRI